MKVGMCVRSAGNRNAVRGFGGECPRARASGQRAAARSGHGPQARKIKGLRPLKGIVANML